ncbi:DNA-binding LacI/PurR family transcriptional regulator [Labrys monachus]|uniref:DNA-binding LacI/PurR family transcriptional regulator n=2 Tax=Labrys monachus TaxID=217067 RepID=A0ABU0FMR2_9HYPH|nr:DNA-binding LacI/PurR family transcriptional regulator [Labrys monachus]
MTVSNVVNKRFGSMGKDVRAEVERAISELGYRPNASGRSLRLAKRFSIGMVVVDESPTFLADAFITRVVAGLSNYLSQRDYGLVVQGMSARTLPQSALVRRHETDALCVLMSGPASRRRRLLERLAKPGHPVVVLQDVGSDSDGVISIRQDDFGGARELAQHMLSRGGRDFVFMAPDVEWPAIEQRIAGVTSALQGDARSTFAVVNCADGGFSDSQAAIARYVAQSGWPNAIMGGNDQMGISALKWVIDQGLRVPEDILVSGFNAFDTWQYTQPMLTTVISPAYEMGASAGAAILDMLEGNLPSERHRLFPVKLQPGGST